MKSLEAIAEIRELIKNRFNDQPVAQFTEAKLADGMTIVSYEGELKEGTLLQIVSEEGKTPATEGTHKLEDGTEITCDAGGKVTAVVKGQAPPEDVPVDAAAVQKMVAEAVEKVKAEFGGCGCGSDDVKKVVEKMAAVSEAVEAENADLKAQVAAFKTTVESQNSVIQKMFELVEKIAAEPGSNPIQTPETFTNKTKERKNEAFDKLAETMKSINQ